MGQLEMKSAFVLCTRADSSRVPRKVFKYINGTPLIEHLVKRLKNTGLEVIVAAPEEQAEQFRFLSKYDVKFYFGSADNPLERMYYAAKRYDVDNIIRVTHDKVFIESDLVFDCLAKFSLGNYDYLYSSRFPAGAGFEVIQQRALKKAYEQFKKAEHISYAVRASTKNVLHYDVPKNYQDDSVRFLLDYEEDFKVLELLFSQLGNDCTLDAALSYCNLNPWVLNLNRMPLVTFYTCAYNAEKWLEQAASSVINQSVFDNSEYIIIDDHSTDRTAEIALHYASKKKNIDFFRNPKNVGLSTSSNIALQVAKGKYIVRLDADDYFIGQDTVKEMIEKLEESQADAIYPDNYFGSLEKIQPGNEQHHVGGALFSTKAINHVKFTDGLRGYEGLDLWHRAKKQLKIAYFNNPAFYYRQHEESLSKNNLSERKLIKQHLDNVYEI